MTTLDPTFSDLQFRRSGLRSVRRIRRSGQRVAQAALGRRAAALAIDVGIYIAAAAAGLGLALLFDSQLLVNLLSLAVTLLNLTLFAASSQSIGTMAVGIFISDERGRPAQFFRIVFARHLLPQLGMLAVAFALLFATKSLPFALAILGLLTLVDLVPVFGEDRRCLHDHLGGTHVVRAK